MLSHGLCNALKCFEFSCCPVLRKLTDLSLESNELIASLSDLTGVTRGPHNPYSLTKVLSLQFHSYIVQASPWHGSLSDLTSLPPSLISSRSDLSGSLWNLLYSNEHLRLT